MAFEDEMRAARRVIRFEVLGRRTVAPSGRVREGLGLGPDDMVKHVERLRFLDGTVFAFERRWFHPAVARHVTPAMLEGMAIITLLGAALGQPPARIVNTVRCLPASPCCARLLGVPPRTSLLETEHTYYAASGAPLLHGSVRFHGERFEFTLDTPIRTSGRGAG
jgi:GntR family transcriptional regulator